MPERQIKVVCGLNNETNILLKERLQEAAAEKGLKLQIVSRYRKEGVYQYVMEHPDYQCVILQEVLQSSSPYTAEDAALLTDERNIKVILVLNKKHLGNRYMRVLYAAGILDALYEEDAYAEEIAALLLQGRTRKEARKYYGIETADDVEKSLQIIDEERLKSFLSYMEGGGPFNETLSRYEFVASRMTAAENLHLIKNMSSGLSEILTGSELFLYYKGYLTGRSKKRFFFFRKKEKEPLESDKVLCSKRTESAIETDSEENEETDSATSFSGVALKSNNMILPELEEPEKSSAIEETFSLSGTGCEEESLFDLFEEEEHVSILHFIEKEEEVSKQKQEDLPAASSIEVMSPQLHQVKKNSQETIVLEKTDEEGKRWPNRNRNILLFIAAAFISLALFFFFYIGVYSEKEIPLIEEVPEIPVSEGLETEAKPAEEALQSQREPIVISEQTQKQEPEQARETEESQKNRMEEQDEQEPTEENKPEEAVGITANQESTKASKSGREPDREQKNVPPERTEEGILEEDSDAVTVVQESLADISGETVSKEQEVSRKQEAQDYNGKIFNGDELEGLAISLQQEGFQVYIITRENGEGYFSVKEIREKCLPACSFLVSVEDSEVKFIEQ